jgi:hypothetical protein
MKIFAFIVAAVAMTFAGCAQLQTLSTIAGAASAANSDLLAANTAIAKASPTVGAFITKHLAQADGYFQDVAATGVLSAAAIAQEQAAVAKVQSYATNMPTSVAGVAADLAQAFTTVQTMTHVPGT